MVVVIWHRGLDVIAGDRFIGVEWCGRSLNSLASVKKTTNCCFLQSEASHTPSRLASKVQSQTKHRSLETKQLNNQVFRLFSCRHRVKSPMNQAPHCT